MTATLALFIALGGGAYAVSHVGSGDIKDNSVRSLDLKNRHGVKGVDVPRNGLGGREIDERSLNASRIVRIAGDKGLSCDPNSPTNYTKCVEASFRLQGAAHVLAIATAGEESVGSTARATCEIQFGNHAAALSSNPGEAALDNTDAGATNGFARTELSDTLGPGKHKVTLACREIDPDVRIDDPTIAVIAVNEPK